MTSPAAYREANREKLRAYARAYHSTPEAKARKKVLVEANRDKITQQILAAKWRRTGVEITRPCPAHCECCGKPFCTDRRAKSAVKKEWACVDHCHLTMSFRGWICRNCNTALGLVDDTLAGAKKLVAYLENR